MTLTPKPELEVVGAVIVRDGLVFCTKRVTGLEAGRWEFPGGKVEPGELPVAALQREITEELAIDIIVGQKITTTTAEIPKAIIHLSTYLCTMPGNVEPTLAADHSEGIWLPPEKLPELDWPLADIPTVEFLVTGTCSGGGFDNSTT